MLANKEAFVPAINKPGEVSATSWIKMVIYSLPGLGKTTCAGTASLVPEMKGVLHINTGDEITALKNATKLELTGTDIVGVPEPDSINFESLQQMEELRWWLINEKHPYKTVIIDTISRIDQIVLDHIVEQSITRNPRLNSGAIRDLNDTNMDDYGKRKKSMIRMIGNYRDLPMNVIFLAHQRNFEGPGKPLKIAPDTSEGISDALCGAVNVVGHLNIRSIVKKGKDGQPLLDDDSKPVTEVHRVLRFKKTGDGIEVKDRTPSGKLGNQIVDPTFQKIYNFYNS